MLPKKREPNKFPFEGRGKKKHSVKMFFNSLYFLYIVLDDKSEQIFLYGHVNIALRRFARSAAVRPSKDQQAVGLCL